MAKKVTSKQPKEKAVKAKKKEESVESVEVPKDQMFVQIEYGFSSNGKENTLAFMGNVSLESLIETLKGVKEEGIAHTIAVVIKPKLVLVSEEFKGKKNALAKTEPHIIPKINV